MKKLLIIIAVGIVGCNSDFDLINISEEKGALRYKLTLMQNCPDLKSECLRKTDSAFYAKYGIDLTN